jgi:hypothetical protein
LEELFRSGRIVDLILVLVGVEALLLGCYHRVTGCGPAPVDLLSNLLSGALLLLAVRLALAQAWWGWLALVLLLSLLAHLLDLYRRWPARD